MANVPPPTGVPQQVAYHRLKAAVASGLGEVKAAASEMEAALALAPNDPSLLLGAAVSEEQAGHLEKAASLLIQTGENGQAKALLGEVRHKQARFSDAIESYRQANEIDPGREDFRIALSRELIALGAFDQAKQELDRALQDFPKSTRLLTLLGILQYAGGQSPAAEQTLSSAIAADPEYEPAYSSLARILLESSGAPGQTEVQVLCRWNQAACAAVRLRLARDNNDLPLQERLLDELRKAPAEDSIAACSIGQAYAWSSRPGQARSPLETCVALDPSPQNHYRLAQVYQKLGKTALAQRELDARTALLRNMTEQTSRAVDTLRSIENRPKPHPKQATAR